MPIGEVDDLAEAFRASCEDGPELVVDPVWGEPAAAALAACRERGRLVQIGQSAGSHSSIASADVRGKLLTIVGHTNFLTPYEVRRDAYRRMCEHAARGELRVEIERVPLEEAADAWRRQRSAPQCKLAIVP